MIIVHTSDIHLSSALNARLDGERLRQRKNELIDSFQNNVEEAILRRAKLFIIAGDLFDTTRVTKRVKDEVIAVIKNARDIDFLYLPGNHEQNTLLDGTVELPENLKVFNKEWTYFNYGFVTVAGRCELERNMFDTLSLDPSRTNIVVLHGAISDRSGDLTVGLKDAQNKNIDYLALGHYHSYDRVAIDERGIAVYSGTPEGRGFDEAGKCGIVLIDTDGDHLDAKFIPTAKREHVIKHVDISDATGRMDVDNAVKSALFEIPERHLVRLILVGKHAPEVYTDTESLTARYKDNHYHLEIIDKSSIKINLEDYRYDRSLKGEFIRLVLSKEDLSEEERERIIKTGIGALACDIGDI